MSSSDDLPCWSWVIIVCVIWDHSTTANKVIVLVEQEACPWELTRFGVSMRASIGSSINLPWATGLTCYPHIFWASLGPWHLVGTVGVNADYAKDCQINVGIIATGLLANWTGVDLSIGVCLWSVDNSSWDSTPQRCVVLQPGINESSSNKVWSTKWVITDLVSRDTTTLLTIRARNSSRCLWDIWCECCIWTRAWAGAGAWTEASRVWTGSWARSPLRKTRHYYLIGKNAPQNHISNNFLDYKIFIAATI